MKSDRSGPGHGPARCPAGRGAAAAPDGCGRRAEGWGCAAAGESGTTARSLRSTQLLGPFCSRNVCSFLPTVIFYTSSVSATAFSVETR